MHTAACTWGATSSASRSPRHSGGSRACAACGPGVVLAWPLTHLAVLIVVPELLHYGGLSGVVHAGVAIVIGQLLLTGSRGQRAVAATVLLASGEDRHRTPWREAVQQHAGWDIGIAPIAHVTGVVSGTVCLLAAHGWSRHKVSHPTHA